AGFQHAYDQHAAAVYATAYRVLGDVSRAQDVVQEVFLVLWRNPERYDPSRASLGSYRGLVARSRALDLWREAQVAGRAAERMRLLAGREEGRVDEFPPEIGRASCRERGQLLLVVWSRRSGRRIGLRCQQAGRRRHDEVGGALGLALR